MPLPLDQDFALVAYNLVAASVPVIATGASAITAESCSPANNMIDPGETVTIDFGLSNVGSANTTNLVATLQATGGVTAPSAPQNYGVLVAGGPSVTRPFTFTSGATCGQTITATFQLQDGATNLGTVTFTFQTGVTILTFSENFDGVTAPALPAGWVAANAVGVAPLWVTSTTTPDTAPNDAFIDDPATVSDKRLDTPNISITSAAAQVSFRNNYALEPIGGGANFFDGGVLEVSSPNIAGGAFTDITNAAVGGSFVTGGYNGTISTAFSNPIGGRMAWSQSSGGYINTVANLGPNVNGQTIKLRFRMCSDSSVSGTGWRVDTIQVSGGSVCCGVPTPTPFPTPTPGTPTPTPGPPTPTPTPGGTPTPTPCAGLSENFDSVTAPALPAGWVAANALGVAPLWVTSATTPDTAPNDAFIDDPPTVSDKRLDTPNIAINSAAAQVSFRNNYALEPVAGGANFYDGGVLEVSSPNIAGGAFTDITDAAVGGSFVTGGYNGTISTAFSNPIAGRMAWSQSSSGYINTVANLGANVNGQTIKLRFRMCSDSSVSGTGWRVDTIVVSGGSCGPTPTPGTPTPTPTAGGTPTPTPACTPAAEGFDDITTLPGAGWVQTNHSTTIGTTGWFQGNSAVFPAQGGATTSYIGANFNNDGGPATDTISNWLLTPPLTLQNGAVLTFFTRTVDVPAFADRLQVRMSTNGASTNVGTTATDVGDFTTLLLDINPTYTLTGYPSVWTQFTVTLSGIASPTTGRLALRYFVENGGPSGANSDYIGIDTFAFNGVCGPTPTPGTPTPTPTPVNDPDDPDRTATDPDPRRQPQGRQHLRQPRREPQLPHTEPGARAGHQPLDAAARGHRQ